MLAWARLMRISNLPTAWSNVLMGAVVAAASRSEAGNLTAIDAFPLIAALLASTFLYLGGMVLNDVQDIEVDRKQRPERVLPSGLIRSEHARLIAINLLSAGLLVAVASSLKSAAGGNFDLRLPAVAFVLVLAIVIYDCGVKAWKVGPIAMGLCRTLNVLLGASAVVGNSVFTGFAPAEWCVALAVGCFVAGITALARTEHGDISRHWLAAGATTMAIAAALLLAMPFAGTIHLPEHSVRMAWMFVLLLAILLLPAARRVAIALRHPGPATVQNAVIVCLLSLVMIDAAIVWLFAPQQPWLAAGVAALAIPAVVAGRWIRGT